jgi:hypothetical protein
MGSGQSSSSKPEGSLTSQANAPARRYSKAELTDRQIQTLEDRNVSGIGELRTNTVDLRYAW